MLRLNNNRLLCLLKLFSNERAPDHIFFELRADFPRNQTNQTNEHLAIGVTF
jgi:hypothetical protein